MFKECVIIVAVSILVKGLTPGFSFGDFPGFSSDVTPPEESSSNNLAQPISFTPFKFGGFDFPSLSASPNPQPAPVDPQSPSNAPKPPTTTTFPDFNNNIFSSFKFDDQGSDFGGIFGSEPPSSSPSPSASPSPSPSPSASPSPSPSPSASPSPSPSPAQLTCPYDNVASACSNVQSAVVPYVLNGQQASPSQWPSVVSIQIPLGPEGCYRHICGGVLVASKWVLTAAHCIEQVIRVSGPISQGALIVSHTPLCRHDGGKQRTYATFASVVPERSFPERDLVMIKLQDRFSGPYATLPNRNFNTNDNVGSIATIVGWGRTAQFQEYKPRNVNQWNQVPLQQGRLQIISRKKCRNQLQGSIVITSEMFCTGDDSQAQHCVGDSGSGLFLDNVLIGITIFGVEFDNEVCLPPAGFAHVSSFVDWINGVINS